MENTSLKNHAAVCLLTVGLGAAVGLVLWLFLQVVSLGTSWSGRFFPPIWAESGSRSPSVFSAAFWPAWYTDASVIIPRAWTLSWARSSVTGTMITAPCR